MPGEYTPDTSFKTSEQIQAGLDEKQPTLVSGENIKTVNGNSILGSGDLDLSDLEVVEYQTTTPLTDEQVAKAQAGKLAVYRNGVLMTKTLEGSDYIEFSSTEFGLHDEAGAYCTTRDTYVVKRCTLYISTKMLADYYSNTYNTITDDANNFLGDSNVPTSTGQQIVRALNLRKTQDMIADVYDATATYSVGDYCIYQNDLYVCNTAISTAESWTAAHWTKTNLVKANTKVIQKTYGSTLTEDEISSFKRGELGIIITTGITPQNQGPYFFAYASSGFLYSNTSTAYTSSGTKRIITSQLQISNNTVYTVSEIVDLQVALTFNATVPAGTTTIPLKGIKDGNNYYSIADDVNIVYVSGPIANHTYTQDEIALLADTSKMAFVIYENPTNNFVALKVKQVTDTSILFEGYISNDNDRLYEYHVVLNRTSGSCSTNGYQIGNLSQANPTLAGTEANLKGLKVGTTKYKVPQGVEVIELSGDRGTLDQTLLAKVVAEPQRFIINHGGYILSFYQKDSSEIYYARVGAVNGDINKSQLYITISDGVWNYGSFAQHDSTKQDALTFNPTVPSGTTPATLSGIKDGNNYYEIKGGNVPAGGTAGQVLSKIDGTDYNTQWVDVGRGSYETATEAEIRALFESETPTTPTITFVDDAQWNDYAQDLDHREYSIDNGQTWENIPNTLPVSISSNQIMLRLGYGFNGNIKPKAVCSALNLDTGYITSSSSQTQNYSLTEDVTIQLSVLYDD